MRIKKIIHCLVLDERIRHNIKKERRKIFFYYIRHFIKNKKEFKMSYIKIYKQAKGIAKTISKQEHEVRATHDACIGIRY